MPDGLHDRDPWRTSLSAAPEHPRREQVRLRESGGRMRTEPAVIEACTARGRSASVRVRAAVPGLTRQWRRPPQGESRRPGRAPLAHGRVVAPTTTHSQRQYPGSDPTWDPCAAASANSIARQGLSGAPHITLNSTERPERSLLARLAHTEAQ